MSTSTVEVRAPEVGRVMVTDETLNGCCGQVAGWGVVGGAVR